MVTSVQGGVAAFQLLPKAIGLETTKNRVLFLVWVSQVKCWCHCKDTTPSKKGEKTDWFTCWATYLQVIQLIGVKIPTEATHSVLQVRRFEKENEYKKYTVDMLLIQFCIFEFYFSPFQAL